METTSNVTNVTNLLQVILDEWKKYENNPILLTRLINCITELPEMLENTNTTIIERDKRKNKLEIESERFIQHFLYNNKFYYHTSTELFFEYNDKNFSLVKEDDIQYSILSAITSNKTLMDWKQKIKVSILKKIKERDVLYCIPESETIQNVINKLHISVCNTKENTKYFLTIIGDILLKKNSNTYLLHPKTKPFLKTLSSLSCMLFGTPNLLNIFKFKFYEHSFIDSRFVDLCEFMNINNWKSYMKENDALDLFCVAAYYSSRYENADNFLLEYCKDDNLRKYALYLKHNTENDIISHFTTSVVENSVDCSISWKNMQFLWKKFIDGKKFQNMFFTTSLKNKLIENLTYDSERDVFLDCTSKLLPTVGKFIRFWNEHMENEHMENENSDTSSTINEEIEIDELCLLFTYHTKTNMNENNILDLIKHYYPEVFIDDDKYLLNTRCKLWNKKEDIIHYLKKYKLITPLLEFNIDEMPINEMYKTYCDDKNKFKVSKRYFEKFIKEESYLYIKMKVL
jgi:hypothetical protein